VPEELRAEGAAPTMSAAAPTTLSYPSAGGVTITAYRWDPTGTPSGVVQLTHGMGDHALRYAELAAVLNARGLVVYGQDHRGHGATAGSPENYGVLGENGWAELVRDIGRLTDLVRAEHPDLPLVLIGHSMGSFALQQYLVDHSDRVSAASSLASKNSSFWGWPSSYTMKSSTFSFRM